jgi:RNA polymerase sigma-70 factor (ECF subfamily)
MTEVHVNGPPVSGRLRFESEMIALRPRLMAFSRSLTRHRERAEDLLQDTHIKALSHWESYEMGTNMFSWLCMIMRNQFYSERRTAWRNLPLDVKVVERTIVDPTINQEDQLGFNQEFAAFAPLLGLLPLDMRDSVIGVHYCGIKYEDLAAVLDVPVGTVKSRVFRGVEALKNLMESERQYNLDLTQWAHAAQDVPRDHPYYPIAKAYEEIYKFLTLNGRRDFTPPQLTKPSEIDAIWRQLLASEEFQFDDEDLDSLMRSNYEPY